MVEKQVLPDIPDDLKTLPPAPAPLTEEQIQEENPDWDSIAPYFGAYIRGEQFCRNQFGRLLAWHAERKRKLESLPPEETKK